MKKTTDTAPTDRQTIYSKSHSLAYRQRRIKSEELFRAQEVIVIEHNLEEYRLRITKNDKLILTK